MHIEYLTYEQAAKIFRDLTPVALDPTYKKAAKLYGNALGEKVGRTNRGTFTRWIDAHYND